MKASKTMSSIGDEELHSFARALQSELRTKWDGDRNYSGLYSVLEFIDSLRDERGILQKHNILDGDSTQ